jgi:DNA-binding LacI/PurR family transcriptional regulator
MKRLPQRTSLVSQTAAIILEEIDSGSWTGWLPGEHELCEQLHVSRTTLRAALDQLHRLGRINCQQGRRREIIPGRRAFQKVQSNRVVALMPDPLQALLFRAFLIDRLREHLASEGYLLDIHVSKVPFRARLPHEMEKLASMLRPAGWVLMNSTEQMQRWFAAQRLPCVLAGSRHSGIELPSVDTDYRAVCRHAVGKFLSRGHQRIVLLSPNPAGAGDVLTETVFREAISQSGSAIDGLVVNHDRTLPDICARLDSLMTRRQPPTAFLVSRARHALTVLCYMLNKGFQVPKDVALISRDDEPYMEDLVPTVARYSNNPNLFALKLSRAVTAMVRGTQTITDQKVMSKFIPGQTLD